jgi:hypothetical protein
LPLRLPASEPVHPTYHTDCLGFESVVLICTTAENSRFRIPMSSIREVPRVSIPK